MLLSCFLPPGCGVVLPKSYPTGPWMPSSCKAYCGMVSSTIVPICPGKPFAFSLLRAFCLLSFDFCFVCFFFLRVFFFYDDDGEMWRTRTLFDDFLMKEILAGRSDDFLGTTNFLTIFLFEDLSGPDRLIRIRIGSLLYPYPRFVTVRNRNVLRRL